MGKATLGIERLHSLEISVFDSAPWVAHLTDGFGFQHLAKSTGAAEEAGGTRRSWLRCGDVGVFLNEPAYPGSPVRRYLERHPEGIARVNFLVQDIEATEAQLLERNAAATDFIRSEDTPAGPWRTLAIATPLGDVEFAFIQTPDAADALPPGMERLDTLDAAYNPLGLAGIDHLTANARTLMPMLAFYEHVMGFSRCWNVQFHTEDFRPGVGSGLKAVAMEDAASGIRMVTNEPLRPRFAESQVQLHVDTNRGPGIQHVALAVADMSKATGHCRSNGVSFMPTPKAYYQALPGRLGAQGVPSLSLSIEEIERLGVLVDGDKSGYLLQAFCQDQAVQFRRPNAGPIFFELVQRCGSQRFGEGNFRALFEAMQR
ncbi:MAG TPA: VOC family protein [Phycisphaerae bacterium]|nr:VOC family protein [Phycisphaerae bacterium]